MNNFKKSITIAIVIFGFMASCTKEREAKIEFLPLQFNVDQNLLSAVYADSSLAFQFQPPQGWNKLGGNDLEQLKQRIHLSISDTSIFRISPEQFFYEPVNKCLCALSSFTTFPEGMRFDSFIRDFQKAFEASLTTQSVKQGYFQLDEFLVYQLLIMDEKNVSFKLICQGKTAQPFEIDYIVPMTVYESLLKSVESSIGSLKSL